MVIVSGTASAQDPDRPPPEPPSEVIYCVRPSLRNVTTELIAPASFAVELDESLGKARITISELPTNATCYAVYKTPSGGSNPIAFAWDPVAIAAPGEFVDEDGFSAGPGEYCYELVLGSPAGRSEPEVRCVTVPLTLAPPEPTPIVVVGPPTRLGPPATGSGLVDSRDDLAHEGLLITLLAVATVIAVAATSLRAARRP